MVKWLKAKYEQLFDNGSGVMTITHGKIHDYLGMQLDFSTPGEVRVTMIPYVKAIVALIEHYDNSKKTAKMPASEHLFKMCEDIMVLPEKQVAIFHTFVVKNLFASKHTWSEISVAVAFLCTCVKNPDEDDWKKLIQLIHYLHGMEELPLILHANSTTVGKWWWVDSSHAIHPNMHSHSGGCMSLSMGMPIMGSSKQKLNTHSLTKMELDMADDFMLQILWMNLFLEVQCYKTLDTILYQDNQSALLEKNGTWFSSKQTKHLNCWYYFMTDRISAGDLSIEMWNNEHETMWNECGMMRNDVE